MPLDFALAQRSSSLNFQLAGPWQPEQNQPQNLTRSWVSVPTTVRLTWTEGNTSQQGDGFRVYRSVNGGAWQLAATLLITETQYDDDALGSGNTYQHRVVEYKGDLESTPADTSLLFVYLCGENQPGSDTRRAWPTLRPQETQLHADSLRRGPGARRQESHAVEVTIRRGPGKHCYDAQQSSDGDYQAAVRVLAEHPGAIDNRAIGLTRPPYSEIVPAVDAISRAPGRGAQESQASSDEWGRVWALARGYAIPQGALDTMRAGIARALAEHQTIHGARVAGLSRAPIEAYDGARDAIMRRIGAVRAANQGAGDAIVRALGKAMWEYASSDDGDRQEITRWLFEATSPSGMAARSPERRLLDELATPQDTMARLWALARSHVDEELALDLLAKAVGRHMGEWPGGEDVLRRGAGKVTTESATSIDARFAWLWRALAASAAASDGDYQVVARVLAEAASGVASVRAAMARFLAEASMATTDTPRRGMATARHEEMAVVAAAAKRLARTYSDHMWETEASVSHYCEYRRTAIEDVRLVGGLSVPGGSSGYRLDRKPFDGYVLIAALRRVLRLEDI